MVELTDKTLLLAYVKGAISKEDKALVERWIQEDPAHEAELLQMARISYAQQTYERINARNPYAAFENVQRKIGRKKRKLMIRRLTTLAACFIGVILLSTIIWHQKGEVPYKIQPQFVTLLANTGMRTEFNLPDGTTVCLNSDSRLTYLIPYSKDERRVLLMGEAFFDVAEDMHHPFIVSTHDDEMQIKVLGTTFNIEAYEDDPVVTATLVKGKINILLNNQGVQNEYTLSPSEKATYNVRDKTFHVKKATDLHETTWTKGILSFKDTPFPEVLRKLTRYYNVEFEVKDRIIETYLFTGTFDNCQLPLVLDYLDISSGIKHTLVQSNKIDSGSPTRRKVILRKKN
ncbi:anti-sigma factor [Bacteroidia bacterium]|nr:anti-sigma factor [Bacteroidia bacterium]